jgi:hypothetical protein
VVHVHQIFAARPETRRTLAATKFELFVTDWSHWTSLEARGGHEEDVGLLLEAGALTKEDLTTTNRCPSLLPIDRLFVARFHRCKWVKQVPLVV